MSSYGFTVVYSFAFRLGEDIFTKTGVKEGSYVLYGGSTALTLDGYGAATTGQYAVNDGVVVIYGGSYKLEGE